MSFALSLPSNSNRDAATADSDKPSVGGSYKLRVPVFALINPQSGSGCGEAVQAQLHRAAERCGVQFECERLSDGNRDPVGRAIERGAKTILVIGGDGTVSKAASIAAMHDVDFGIVPTGTANLIAKSLAIPEDTSAAIDLIFGGHRVEKIDGMRQGIQLAFSHVSMGTYSRIAVKENAVAKRRFGKLVYVARALREIVANRDWRFDLDLDGVRHRRRASLVLIANVHPVGIAGMSWGDQIRPSDGRIEVCVIRAKGFLGHVSLLYNALKGRTAESDQIEYLTATTSIKVSSKRPLPVRADGEILDRATIDIDVIPAVLPVIVPQQVN
ncbi:diacylglycerol/lipid kinase family protein [Rhodopirellula sp. MGV]|uniref:diacylglycerol/lipid kinase family protein n=1 Tax=Rhodopirellula sp. MGV TaxID=2023130 RepID=UPI000CD29C19|nr:diacylglycerol kinase family protein [Rhodopirellula sp. MGV]